jgi:quinoprotein glucose dehydrogenase
MFRCALAGIGGVLLLLPAPSPPQSRRISRSEYNSWKVYGGGPEGIRYSALTQIDRSNANRLIQAWTFDTGDAAAGSEMQCNPIVVNGTLYATTPQLRVIALDAATGKLKWSFDPNEKARIPGRRRNRGVTYWTDGQRERIFLTWRHLLHSIDARTGQLDPEFGDRGVADLRAGLGRDPLQLNVSAATPGIIYKDLLILGSLVSEDLPSAPGDIRAFDVRTGKVRWAFHTIPRPGDFGHDTWPPEAWKYAGGANNWAGMALDEKRGIVFVPTGSASYDFYGANRHGDNLFANCMLALNAESGERIWHFQVIRHDVWDRDFPSPPSLVRVRREGRLVDAVAQIAKSGHVWLWDRETGKPLFPVEERVVPQSEVPGERLALRQPVPRKPPAFARQILTEDMLTRRNEAANRAVTERFRQLVSTGQFAPPSFQGSIVFPGYDGGGEWGGAAFDPETAFLYVNSNEMAWILRIVPRPEPGPAADGKQLYSTHCAGCHKDDLKGSPPEVPSLEAIGTRFTEGEMAGLIRTGLGRMPALPQLPRPAQTAIARFLITGTAGPAIASGGASPFHTKYTTDGYNKFLDPDGYPAVAPPWGTLNAIDLDNGEIAWKIPFGEFPELVAQGIRNTGSENYGGPVVTAGGLVFIGATNHDNKFHVFDKKNGKLLWETTLPAAGNATPAVYEVNGRQFVVIACGGGKSGRPSGGTYVAFALPEK